MSAVVIVGTDQHAFVGDEFDCEGVLGHRDGPVCGQGQTAYIHRASAEPSTSARLRQAQQALAASQADLTRVANDRDEEAALAVRLRAFWNECCRDRDLITAELASARKELELLRGATCQPTEKSMTTKTTGGTFGPGRNFSAEITGPGRGTVKIDGHDISNAVRSLQISAGIHDVTAVTLDLGIVETTRIEVTHAEVSMGAATLQLLLDAGWTPPEGSGA